MARVPPASVPGGNGRVASPHELRMPVELTLTCANLPNMDTLSKSDPFVVVVEKLGDGSFVELGQTEVVQDNLDPRFATAIQAEYRFEENQYLTFRVYDMDDPSKPPAAQDFIGEVQVLLSSLVRSHETKLELRKGTVGNRGTISISAEEVRGSQDEVVAVFYAQQLSKGGKLSRPDAVLEISRLSEGSPQLVYRSEAARPGTSCVWQPVRLPVHRICGGDFMRPLQLCVYNSGRNGSSRLIGSCSTSLRQLLDKPGIQLQLLDSHRNSCGGIGVNSITVDRRPTFLEYVAAGFEISVVVAIDFTASNGDPASSSSLHYRDPMRPNQYLQAIMSVCNIVAQYDKDQRFPVYGFGACLPSNEVSHCFPCTFNPNMEEVQGVQGIIDVYAHALNTVRLFGPTLFAPVINKTAQRARQSNGSYYILLILTDGEICDMEDTIDAIVAASTTPMSIIIVGIGAAEFKNMNILDADETPLRSRKGVMMARDIVQFVPMRKYENAQDYLLARDTLVEVPGQFLSWAKAANVFPPGSVDPRGTRTPEQLLSDGDYLLL
eukprot:TRINITY_DN67217_c0_g1_i1.p1 TRINITY_DN67217_c0_g1~~TRINITY_DN67217_c0_g1_i1.p1  ORF type:complete len:550 (+),score=88.35 TRINITY_DN67217_c0_g1_i1:41-1690(+)